MSSPIGTGGGLRPVIDDPDTRGFFAAARDHRLVVQTCRDCGQQQQPPRPRCRTCRGGDLGWADVPGVGTVHTWTVVEHQINPHFPTPYTAVLVDVEPRPGEPPVRFLGHLGGRPPLAVGDPVRVTFVDLGDGTILPNWEPARDDATPRTH
ncbi:Zn-ribbon domain-containing OB-fold protein [Georgenia ruanii]|uniref:3-ketoacyl-CoA thiolase n=1 Tax=Georgenia ruanii TaxID=348442 RepID=A0A7J9UV28_9MICO|nr:zinc ribbon domain-containing protein [Georgenia ruanii]MPV88457.1 3-ketoacyl-CoA thiolase [Georgenia ruanii]